MQSHDAPQRVTLRRIARQAMIERGLEPDLPPAAVIELSRIAASPHPPDGSLRDFRTLPWCSIDNDDSLDLDQLTVATSQRGSTVKILVAVADVDALVPKASAIDAHARANTTSVYTAAEVFPMLPERLSTDLTSLAEQQDRPAVVVEMLLGRDGALDRSQLSRGIVCNRAKLAYDGVAAWLDGKAAPPAPLAAVAGLADNLKQQDEVAQTLRGLRHEHGALDLQTVEARPVFDAAGLRDLAVDEKNRAKVLIEDFMIAANGVTARFLATKGVPALRRVVRTPKRWDRIAAIAEELGTHLPVQPDSRALSAFLAQRRAADPLRFPDLSLAVIKLLGAGEYVVELPGQAPPGHFGLAVRDYTHATAPNRRFPDLVTQRLIKGALGGTPSPYTADELLALARHCTDQEDAANKVERRVAKSAAAMLLAGRIGERFDGIVTGAAEKGTWVRIFTPPVEGRVVGGAGGLDVGHRVRVALVRTDVERGFIDFEALPAGR